jgi:EAL domain-containing protein (putative c-di-GMP-specific phosphodiesterase class I)
MEWFESKIDLMQFWITDYGTSSRVENKLKTIDLSSRKIDPEIIAAVNSGGNKISIAM